MRLQRGRKMRRWNEEETRSGGDVKVVGGIDKTLFGSFSITIRNGLNHTYVHIWA